LILFSYHYGNTPQSEQMAYRLTYQFESASFWYTLFFVFDRTLIQRSQKRSDMRSAAALAYSEHCTNPNSVFVPSESRCERAGKPLSKRTLTAFRMKKETDLVFKIWMNRSHTPSRGSSPAAARRISVSK
jgi:hypothetical protein